MAFLLLDPASSPVLAGAGSIVMGFGMGFLNSSAVVMIQSSVEWAERGSATASNVFSRNLGSTLGATVLGGVLNLSLAHRGADTSVDFDQIRELLDHPGFNLGNEVVRAALAQSLHLTFVGVFLLAVLALMFATRVPRARATG